MMIFQYLSVYLLQNSY